MSESKKKSVLFILLVGGLFYAAGVFTSSAVFNILGITPQPVTAPIQNTSIESPLVAAPTTASMPIPASGSAPAMVPPTPSAPPMPSGALVPTPSNLATDPAKLVTPPTPQAPPAIMPDAAAPVKP